MTPEADGEPGRLSARLTEVEIKASFAEDVLDQLNAVIIRQQAQIDRLMAELASLRETVSRGLSTGGNATEELPPHY